MSCGVGCRLGLDPTLLWLWHRPAAIALIRPLGWEPPCAAGVALKKKTKNKKRKILSAPPQQAPLCPHIGTTPKNDHSSGLQQHVLALSIFSLNIWTRSMYYMVLLGLLSLSTLMVRFLFIGRIVCSFVLLDSKGFSV